LAGAALLDADKLDCYLIALEFHTIAGQLVPKRGYAERRDQLDRASISTVLNIAEGCGRRSPADKGRFYAMARGRATECAAIVDMLGARGLVDVRLRNRARALLIRIALAHPSTEERTGRQVSGMPRHRFEPRPEKPSSSEA
jgi:four helix bundle protein